MRTLANSQIARQTKRKLQLGARLRYRQKYGREVRRSLDVFRYLDARYAHNLELDYRA